MALEMTGELDEGQRDTPAFTYGQMAEVVRERDQYRQALYDATNARLVGADKAVEALSVVDQLHRELHTVCKERDKARLELNDADEILDSPLRTIRFAVGVISGVARERARHRRQTAQLRQRPKPRRARR